MENNVNSVFSGNLIEDHTWVTGGDATIAHKRLIDEGAFGEVHHVNSIADFAKALVV